MRRLNGYAACPGIVRAGARVVFGLDPEVESFPRGSILVVQFSTPMLYPLFLRASAVVAERGGRTCHAATLSRELGIPCVVGVPDATRWIRDGASVLVDGGSGAVIIEDDE